MEHLNQFYTIFETAHGYCAIVWKANGITRFRLPVSSADGAERDLLRVQPGIMPGAPPPHVTEAIAIAKRYYEGEAVDFSHIPVDLDELGEFSKQIYTRLRCLAWGHTTTYGGLAKELGIDDWEGARDVGQAMGKNPVPLIIPCHRVLAAGNKIGGFSAPGGAETKMRMLELEGVRLGPPPPAQGSLGF
jgi:methylated-DNA-[protein]-cysteine S-methyltransferase